MIRMLTLLILFTDVVFADAKVDITLLLDGFHDDAAQIAHYSLTLLIPNEIANEVGSLSKAVLAGEASDRIIP